MVDHAAPDEVVTAIEQRAIVSDYRPLGGVGYPEVRATAMLRECRGSPVDQTCPQYQKCSLLHGGGTKANAAYVASLPHPFSFGSSARSPGFSEHSTIPPPARMGS